LITNDSTSEMLKLGAIQAVIGFVFGAVAGACTGRRSLKFATIVSLGAAASSFGYLPLSILGAAGAVFAALQKLVKLDHL